jgi:hypothetical protein
LIAPAIEEGNFSSTQTVNFPNFAGANSFHTSSSSSSGISTLSNINKTNSYTLTNALL